MVKLFCTMAGVEGNPFSLSVDEGDSVNELKMAIKVEKHDTIKCEADTLDLFLAKTENGAWLDEDGAAAVTLDVDGHLQGFEQMDASLSINNDKHFGKNFQPGEGQIHVLVVAPGQQAAFIKKQLRYKRMCTEISCRNFLDALAQQLAMLYTFDFNCEVPTMDDVFYAVDNGTWKFRVSKLQQLTKTELPNFFDMEEWTLLRDLNKRTNFGIHDGVVQYNEHPYVILPHDFFSGDEVEMLKNIATTGDVVVHPTEFRIEDEDELSSSRSSRERRL